MSKFLYGVEIIVTIGTIFLGVNKLVRLIAGLYRIEISGKTT